MPLVERCHFRNEFIFVKGKYTVWLVYLISITSVLIFITRKGKVILIKIRLYGEGVRFSLPKFIDSKIT